MLFLEYSPPANVAQLELDVTVPQNALTLGTTALPLNGEESTESRFRTTHLDKLTAVLTNPKVSDAGKAGIRRAIEKYHLWINQLKEASTVGSPGGVLNARMAALNEYRNFLDIEVIFDSPDDYLYTNKGQLKLDNSVLEEFMPWAICPETLPLLLNSDLVYGPAKTFAGASFNLDMDTVKACGSLNIKTKNQDFSICRREYLRTSESSEFSDHTTIEVMLGLISVECKTNLDKTMFQEASATAREVTAAVPGAKYFMMAEWLDMKPISSSTTEIAKTFIARKGKRLSSDLRKKFSAAAGRAENREAFVDYLQKHPIHVDVFQQLLDQISLALTAGRLSEDVLALGSF